MTENIAVQAEPRRKKRFSSPVPFIALGLLTVILVAAWIVAGRNQYFGEDIGPMEDYAPGSVTFVPEYHLFIIRYMTEQEGSFIGFNAISDLEPVSRCRVQWQPDRDGGVFVEPCQNSTYDRFGKLISGPGAKNLRLLPIRIGGGVIFVLPAERASS